MNAYPEQQRIVVGVHDSAASRGALRWAAGEAALRGSRLQVIRAWEDEARKTAPYASHFHQPGRQDNHRKASARLEETVRAVAGALPQVTVTVEVARGLPARVLIDRAAGAELLVVGSAAGVTADALGPVARVCLRKAPCPVVVVSLTSTPGAPVPA